MDAKRIQVRKRVAEIIDAAALLTAALQDQLDRVFVEELAGVLLVLAVSNKIRAITLRVYNATGVYREP